MQSPAVAFIEMAIESTETPDWIIQSEVKEFNSLGDKRKDDAMIRLGVLDPMTAGYLLGLETARVLLSKIPGNKVTI